MLALGKLVQHQDGMKVGAVGLGGAVHPANIWSRQAFVSRGGCDGEIVIKSGGLGSYGPIV